MIPKNILIVSLNFNPGHFSHLVANYKLFEDAGYNPYLYINAEFNKMDKNEKYNKINFANDLKKIKSVELALFWFPSLFNIVEIIRLRVLYKSTIAYVYHEPFESIKKYYNSGFSFRRILKIYLIDLISIVVILLTHKIILPSSKAFNLYKEKYSFYNKKFTNIPLIFDDEASNLIKLNYKKYFSYIGTIANDHAFCNYINFIESAIKNQWFPNLLFLIATKSIIPNKERKIIEPYLNSGRIIISEGHPMTNEEINSYYNDSLIVWNAYNRSMQSGVLPKAYMFGAAVIGSYQCDNEFVDNHKTGVLVKDNNNVNEIKSASNEMIEKRNLFYLSSRNKFLDNFYYKKNIEKFVSLLK